LAPSLRTLPKVADDRGTGIFGFAALGFTFDTEMGVEPVDFGPEFLFERSVMSVFPNTADPSGMDGPSWSRMIVSEVKGSTPAGRG